MIVEQSNEANTVSVPLLSRVVDKIIIRLGEGIAWLNLVLVFVILTQVILRYVFGMGQIFLEETQWHLYAVLVMFGVSYGTSTDSHIRMDLLHRNYSERKREWVELFGLVFFLIPFTLILMLKGIDLVESSWRVNEGSPSPGGLPWRWAIKAVLPVSMFLYFVAAVSRIIRSVAVLLRIKRQIQKP